MERFKIYIHACTYTYACTHTNTHTHTPAFLEAPSVEEVEDAFHVLLVEVGGVQGWRRGGQGSAAWAAAQREEGWTWEEESQDGSLEVRLVGVVMSGVWGEGGEAGRV